MYLQFFVILASGLLGLCLVLTILLDYVFVDWDLFEGFRNWIRQVAQHKRSYAIIQNIEETGGAPRLVSRLIPERRHGQRADLEASLPVVSLPHLETSYSQEDSPDEQTLATPSSRAG
jgi:hypothetical protein